MHRRTLLAAVAALALAHPLAAHEYTLGSLKIGHPYAIETPATARTGAGYLTVTNTGSAPDRLLEIRTAFPRTQIHATTTDSNGVARMEEVGPLDIPPGATVELAPGGMHVMFMGLDAPLASGAAVPATLVFEKAGEIAVEFKVQPRTAGGDDMPGMAH